MCADRVHLKGIFLWIISARAAAGRFRRHRRSCRALRRTAGFTSRQSLPSFSLDEIASLAKLGYTGRAVEVLSRFLTDFTRGELTEYVGRAYAKSKFLPEAVAPVVPLGGDGAYILELFHGRPAPLRISRSSFCRFC